MTSGPLLGRVLVDAGPLVAVFRESDQHHRQCVETLGRIIPPLLTSWPVLSKAVWLLRESDRAVDRLLAGGTSDFFRILPLDDSLFELRRLLRRYRTLGAQLADVSLVHLAHRERLDVIFTLDRRDFTVYRGPGNRPFQLLPDV